VYDKRTLQSLSVESGRSIKSLQRLFAIFLNHPPEPVIKPNDHCYLIIDGTYFQTFCLVYYYDTKIKHLQFYSIMAKENYDDIAADLELLKLVGLTVVAVTTDGHKALIKAVKTVFPTAIRQRCIVHVQRMSRIYLTRFPKTPAGRELRLLVGELHKIATHAEKNEWVEQFNDWAKKHYNFLCEKSVSPTGRKWYIHKLLRRTRSLITNALPDMFHYLDDGNIPKSTNGVESRFSYVKSNVSIHRGLTEQRQKNFILWYHYFKYND